MKNLILTLLVFAITIPTLIAQPAGYDKNFRKIGEYHNQVLKIIFQLFDADPSYDEILRLTSDQTSKLDPETKYYDAYQDYPEIKQFTDGYFAASNKVNFLSNYLPSNANSYVNEMVIAARLDSHDQRVAALEGIIKNVIADRGLETATKNSLLYGAAIGINSSALWSGKDGTIDWKNAPRTNRAMRSAKAGGKNQPANPKSVEGDDDSIIEEDITGGIAGAIVGGVAGTVGAPVTATGGAIMGGGIGSGKVALKRLWGWLTD